MTRFTGQRILVTGGSQGIGRACCELFAREGGEVLVNYSRNDDAARQVETAIRASGGKAAIVKADLGVAEEVERMWSVAERAGGVDVLVLNAAFQKKALPEDTDLALMEKTLRVNVVGNFDLAKRFIAARRAARKPGAIVVHSSNQGEFVNPTGFAYALSKAALNHMVRHLARSTVKDRIRVNGVALGWFDTDGERKFYSSEQIQSQAASSIPMGRAGDPMEAARLAAFLACDESSYMTGTIVRYDGGFALDPDLST